MLIPKEIERFNILTKQANIFILFGCIIVFLITFLFQYDSCSQIIRKVGDSSCDGNEIFRNVLITDTVSINYKRSYIPLSPLVDLRILNFIQAFRGVNVMINTIPAVEQYIKFIYVVNSTGEYSLTPLQKTINNNELLPLIEESFNYNLTYYDVFNTNDCYDVNMSDVQSFPPYLYNASVVSTICGRLVSIDIWFNSNSYILKLNDEKLNFGQIFFYEWYTDYLEKFYRPLHWNNYSLENQYFLLMEEELFNTTKTLLLERFVNSLAGDYSSGMCIGTICENIGVIVITSILNANNAVSVLGCVFTWFAFRYYRVNHNIDCKKLLDDADRIEIIIKKQDYEIEL